VVTQRVAGQGEATYYVNARIIDESVSPPLEDGEYELSYVGESEKHLVYRRDGIWFDVPPSSKKPHRE
jgi:hypothetical protein